MFCLKASLRKSFCSNAHQHRTEFNVRRCQGLWHYRPVEGLCMGASLPWVPWGMMTRWETPQPLLGKALPPGSSDAQGGVQTPNAPPAPAVSMRGVCARRRGDSALVKVRHLRRPLRGGVSSSEVGSKPCRKPVDQPSRYFIMFAS